MIRALALILVVALGVLSWSPPADAHGRDTSHSRWRVRASHLDVALRVAARECDRLGGARQVAERVNVDVCVPDWDTLDERHSDRGDVVLRWSLDCDAGEGPPRVTVELFEALGPAHVHMLSYELEGGEVHEQVLSAATPALTLTSAGTRDPSWSPFLGLGFAHILEGWDHLAFVLALLLGATRLREVAALVTGFTLGHSVTLALSALGLTRLDGSSIELLIAASVVVVAAEDGRSSSSSSRAVPEQVVGLFALAALVATIRGQPCALTAWGATLFAWAYLRWGERGEPAQPPGASGRRLALVAGFGLVHGAGFAGVLQSTGLPPGARVGSLLAFNLGVELGQLCFVAAAWPLLVWARRRGVAIEPWLVLGLMCLGAAWLLFRAAG